MPSALGFLPAAAVTAFGAATIPGAFMPWGTGRVLFISQTVDGFDLDGEITMGVGIALIIGAAAYHALRTPRILFALYSLAGGLAIIAVCLWQWTRLETVILQVGPFTLRITPEVTVGEGLILTLVSGAAVVLIALWQFVVAYRTR